MKAALQAGTGGRRLIRVFPRKTKATPCDELARFGPPDLLDEADEDTFDAAEKRLKDIQGLGFTPMAMLWRPETPSQMKWAPDTTWRAFQRRWARPAIIHAKISEAT